MHICVNPKKEIWVFLCVCVFKREGGSVRCEVIPPPPPLHRDKAICVKWQHEEDGPQSNEVLNAAGSKRSLTEARRMQPLC